MLKKKYSDKTNIWYITFQLSKDVAADTAYICGDFNDWDTSKNKMRKMKNGSFTATLQLKPGKYRFRYWVNDERWENDWQADDYAPNDFGSEDSMVIVDDPPSTTKDPGLEQRLGQYS